MVFNPRATVQVVRFDDQHFCLVVDDALSDPETMQQIAVDRFQEFNSVDFSYYPGNYLMAPAAVTEELSRFFQFNARRHFDARRCLESICRYSIATTLPEALQPLQWLCHRDDVGLDPKMSMQASVLYLFREASLGGTGFYTPTHNASVTGALFADARRIGPADFSAKYGISPGYMHDGNFWFQRIGAVAARWNRLIIYDGGMLHASDITQPALLSADPRVGRLTLNGFFTCRRHLT